MRSNAMESSWLNQSRGVFEMLFSKFDVEEALEELVDELAMRNINVTSQIVGGAAVALQDSREELTQDIDAFHPPSLGFDEAVESVRRKRDWPLTWFNDTATMFASHYETEKDWDLCFMREKDDVNADLYVEDAPHNVLRLQEAGADVVVFANSTNVALEHTSNRVATWDEAEATIRDRYYRWLERHSLSLPSRPGEAPSWFEAGNAPATS